MDFGWGFKILISATELQGCGFRFGLQDSDFGTELQECGFQLRLKGFDFGYRAARMWISVWASRFLISATEAKDSGFLLELRRAGCRCGISAVSSGGAGLFGLNHRMCELEEELGF